MRSRAGFTLLEVMLAMAILAVSLVVVMRVMDQAALVTRYQDQQITAATLARFKMVELEIQIEKDGFPSEDGKEECGNFVEDDLNDIVDQGNGLEAYEYCWTLKKVDLPIPMDMLGGKEGKENGQGMQNSPLSGGLPGGLTPDAAAEQLSKAVRVLQLTVKWKTGEIPQELSVTTHLVNMTQAQVL